jgi:hypothetical protein
MGSDSDFAREPGLAKYGRGRTRREGLLAVFANGGVSQHDLVALWAPRMGPVIWARLAPGSCSAIDQMRRDGHKERHRQKQKRDQMDEEKDDVPHLLRATLAERVLF